MRAYNARKTPKEHWLFMERGRELRVTSAGCSFTHRWKCKKPWGKSKQFAPIPLTGPPFNKPLDKVLKGRNTGETVMKAVFESLMFLRKVNREEQE